MSNSCQCGFWSRHGTVRSNSHFGTWACWRNRVSSAQRSCYRCFSIPQNSVYWDGVILLSLSFGMVRRTLSGSSWVVMFPVAHQWHRFDSTSPVTLWQEINLWLSCSQDTAAPPAADGEYVGWSPLELLFPSHLGNNGEWAAIQTTRCCHLLKAFVCVWWSDWCPHQCLPLLFLPSTTSMITSRCISVSFSQYHEESERAVAKPNGCISLGNKHTEQTDERTNLYIY